tara:strand:- start:137 stop:517 length:381 start_codon:yes stop_codon:yes gene_type:complete
MVSKTTPLSFNIDSDTIARIEAFKERTQSASTSAIIRTAIERYDFDQIDTSVKEGTQVSLRIEPSVRDKLKAIAKSQGVSVGFLIRECIINFVNEDEENPQPRVGNFPKSTYEEPNPKETENPFQI